MPWDLITFTIYFGIIGDNDLMNAIIAPGEVEG